MRLNRCIKCQQEKLISEFVRRSEGVYRNTCLECCRAKKRADYADPDRGRKAYAQAYYTKNRDACIARVTQWQLENKDRLRDAQRKHLKRRVSTVNDTYARGLLAHGTTLDPASFDDGLVKLKRLELLVKRTCKEMQK